MKKRLDSHHGIFAALAMTSVISGLVRLFLIDSAAPFW